MKSRTKGIIAGIGLLMSMSGSIADFLKLKDAGVVLIISITGIFIFIVFFILWMKSLGGDEEQIAFPESDAHEEKKDTGLSPYSKLLNCCLGDEEKANRLVDYEMRKNPHLSREEAIENAVDSFRTDNEIFR